MGTSLCMGIGFQRKPGLAKLRFGNLLDVISMHNLEL